LHTFVLVRTAEVATADGLRELSARSTRHAIKHKGGLPRGLQTGVAVLPVLVCRTAEPGAVEVARQAPPKRFAAFTLPLVVELDRASVATCSEERAWGALYQDFLGEQQRLVAGDLSGSVLPSGGESRAVRRMLLGGVIGGITGAVLALLVLVSLLLR
jgi:hypothetical protein